MANEIQLDDRYTMTHDGYQWILTEWRDGKTNKGEPKRTPHHSYFAKVTQCLTAYMEISGAEGGTMAEVLDLMEKASTRFSEAVERQLKEGQQE